MELQVNVLYIKLKHFNHASLVTYQFIIVQLAVQQWTQNIKIQKKCKKCQDKISFPEVSVKKKTKQVLIGNYFQRRPR